MAKFSFVITRRCPELTLPPKKLYEIPEVEPALFSGAEAPISSRSPTNINKGLDEDNDVLLSSMNRSVNSPNRLS